MLDASLRALISGLSSPGGANAIAFSSSLYSCTLLIASSFAYLCFYFYNSFNIFSFIGLSDSPNCAISSSILFSLSSCLLFILSSLLSLFAGAATVFVFPAAVAAAYSAIFFFLFSCTA